MFENGITYSETLQKKETWRFYVSDHSIREILAPSPGFNSADGPFQNILRISRMGLDNNFADR